MKPEDGKTNPESPGASRPTASDGPRQPYGPPRLRSLGRVNAITLGPSGDARRKPQG